MLTPKRLRLHCATPRPKPPPPPPACEDHRKAPSPPPPSRGGNHQSELNRFGNPSLNSVRSDTALGRCGWRGGPPLSTDVVGLSCRPPRADAPEFERRIDRARGAAEPDTDLVLLIVFRCREKELLGMAACRRNLLSQWGTVVGILRLPRRAAGVPSAPSSRKVCAAVTAAMPPPTRRKSVSTIEDGSTGLILGTVA